jgi:imidazolonepropionase-like amidohydrolase
VRSFLLARLGQTVLVVVLALTAVFGMVRLTGDPVLLFMPMDIQAKDVDEFRERLGFNDPLLVTTQYTVAEMRAAVEETDAVGKYVLAHAYSDSAVRNAIASGVRCIEHGNLIREEAAAAIAAAGAYLVPTLVTYEAIYREGKRYGIGDHQIAKIDLAREQSLQGLTYAYRAGCKIGSGSDLLGDMMSQRHVELELKAQVMTPMEVLRSATAVNAEIFRMSGQIGTVEPGKYADLIVIDGDPLRDLRAFQRPDNPRLVMKAGTLHKNTL